MSIEEKLLFYNPRDDEEDSLIKLFLKGSREQTLIYDLVRCLGRENVADDNTPVGGDVAGGKGQGYHWSQKHLACVDSVVGAVYLIGEQQEEELPLVGDPSKTGYSSFYDVEKNFLEEDSANKGRAVPPISLHDFPDLVLGDRRKVIACDPARFGDDKTVILIRYGIHVIDIQSFAKQDTVVTTQKILDAVREHKPDEVVVDATGGLGAGVVDQLKKEGIESECTLTEVTLNEVPREDRLNPANARAEMYLLLQERFRKGEITIPGHKMLAEQISSIKYEYGGDNEKIRISPKSKTKKRMGYSPDFADALALAFYGKPELQIY